MKKKIIITIIALIIIGIIACIFAHTCKDSNTEITSEHYYEATYENGKLTEIHKLNELTNIQFPQTEKEKKYIYWLNNDFNQLGKIGIGE